MRPIPFDNSYVRLPEQFYTRLLPTAVSAPEVIRVNDTLAAHLGIDPTWLSTDSGINMVAGNQMPEGADPIATVYAGHQFGSWNPQLGDGRALLLGELVAPNGQRYDLQLKGSGPTPYSRGGDGRAPLGPVLREYIVSEAMTALGISSTRALAAVTTGDQVEREGSTPGAILMRIAQSHIRIGTFQFFASRRDVDALRALTDHTIERHYPGAMEATNPAIALLENVISRQAELIASWQLIGFVHGVMNTDNMLVSGETVDYGPCAFMDAYTPDLVLSSIDHAGRYAYGNQPRIAHWNLMNLAQSLLPVIDQDRENAAALAQASIDTFPDLFREAHRRGINRKLGLHRIEAGDESLADDLMRLMTEEQTDFTLTFRRLSELSKPGLDQSNSVGEMLELPHSFGSWLGRWHDRLDREAVGSDALWERLRSTNPAFIPRNHLIEEAIEAATRRADLGPFHQLVNVLTHPFDYESGLSEFALPPRPDQVVRQTFCGT